MLSPVIAAWLSAIFLVALPALLIKPFVRRCVSELGVRAAPVLALAVTVAPPIFLLSFSLWARLLPNYGLSIAAAFASLGVLSWLSRRPSEDRQEASADLPLAAVFGILFTTSYILRTFWPALHWENSFERLGVERLFNLSLQQSFLHGSAWPTENLWLAGEPLNYYVLLRAYPGICSWLARVALGSPLSGGALYLIFDAFYLTLAPLAVMAWLAVLLEYLAPRSSSRPRAIIAALCGCGAYLTPHWPALWAGLYSYFGPIAFDFWTLQHEVVPKTVNFFPFGLLLSGESHSYAVVPFLQVSVWGAFALMLAARRSLWICLLLGSLSAALAMSHSSSVLLALTGFVAATSSAAIATLLNGNSTQAARNFWLRELAMKLFLTAALALALALPELMTQSNLEVRWVWVTKSLASPFLPFLEAQAAPLLCTLALLLGSYFTRKRLNLRNPSLFFGLSAFLLSLPLGYPAIGIALFVWGLVAAQVSADTSCTPVSGGVPLTISAGALGLSLLTGVLVSWIFPEILVADWAIDQRTDWIRFNLVMRFWLEGYYLVPTCLTLCLAPGLLESLAQNRTRLLLVMPVGLMSLAVCLADVALVRQRILRTPEHPSADGISFMRTEHPDDWWLIDYLARLPGPVVLGEACGSGSTPANPIHYSWAGRLSAYSGRASVCGWSRHTWMFQRTFKRGLLRGKDIWPSFAAYEADVRKLIQTAQSALSPLSQSEALHALSRLRERGITHLAFGELEERVYGKVDLASLARIAGGRVLLEPRPGLGVIQLTSSSE